MIPASFVSLVLALGGPSEDGFADNLTIPAELEITLPVAQAGTSEAPPDDFQRAMLTALETAPSTDPTIIPSLPSLRRLSEKDRELLIRSLASSPAWRVFEERGALFATRRWNLNGNWRWELHGYYSSHEVREFRETNYFQSRTTLCLKGKPWARGSADQSRVTEGTSPAALRLSRDNNSDESYCIIDCGGLLLELFEQSRGRERRLTKATIAFLEAEFAKVLEASKWSTDLLGEGGFRRGSPTIELSESFQPGIYDLSSWLNPGEPGTVYLRAFEITRDIRLSEDRLFSASNEQIGWSEKSDELFLYDSHVTIYEGDWGKPYAARFEIWFAPASGAAERKLLERNFQIEGWQR